MVILHRRHAGLRRRPSLARRLLAPTRPDPSALRAGAEQPASPMHMSIHLGGVATLR